MTRTAGMFALALLAAVAAGSTMAAQSRPDTEALRAAIERRFEVLPLRDGVALRPRTPVRDVRSIEVTRGSIALDGQPVTGAELRARLGDASDAILQLSYLSDAERRAMFFPGAAPAVPDVPVPPAPPVPPAVAPPSPPPDFDQDRPRPRRRSRDSDLIRIGNSVTVRAGQVVDGDVVAVGGSVRVDGEVHGDVVSVGGNVNMGPQAIVDNNVVVIGGRLERADTARIGGQVQEVSLGNFHFGPWQWPLGAAETYRSYWGSRFGSALSVFAILTRLAVLCLLAALVVLLGHRHADRAGDRALREPLKSGATGFLVQLLFIPTLVITILALVITIIGIPLLLLIPFAVLGLAVLGLVGFTGVAERIGRWCADRLGWQIGNAYAATTFGTLVIMSPAVLARIIGMAGPIGLPMSIGLGLAGWFVEYLAWTIGFGALALARFDRSARAEA